MLALRCRARWPHGRSVSRHLRGQKDTLDKFQAARIMPAPMSDHDEDLQADQRRPLLALPPHGLPPVGAVPLAAYHAAEAERAVGWFRDAALRDGRVADGRRVALTCPGFLTSAKIPNRFCFGGCEADGGPWSTRRKVGLSARPLRGVDPWSVRELGAGS